MAKDLKYKGFTVVITKIDDEEWTYKTTRDEDGMILDDDMVLLSRDECEEEAKWTIDDYLEHPGEYDDDSDDDDDNI